MSAETEWSCSGINQGTCKKTGLSTVGDKAKVWVVGVGWTKDAHAMSETQHQQVVSMVVMEVNEGYMLCAHTSRVNHDRSQLSRSSPNVGSEQNKWRSL